MSKYYTPELEEFHVGFEYQSLWGLEGINEEWHDEVYSEKDCVNNLCGTLRVKHLDREDIESLGFYCHPTDNRVFHNKDGIIINTGWSSPVRKDEPTLVITHQVFDESKTRVIHEHYLFNGTIKNKSELKRILKQLGI